MRIFLLIHLQRQVPGFKGKCELLREYGKLATEQGRQPAAAREDLFVVTQRACPRPALPA